MLMYMQKINENGKDNKPTVTTSRLAHTAEVGTLTVKWFAATNWSLKFTEDGEGHRNHV